jgi:hypothetical protein
MAFDLPQRGSSSRRGRHSARSGPHPFLSARTRPWRRELAGRRRPIRRCSTARWCCCPRLAYRDGRLEGAVIRCAIRSSSTGAARRPVESAEHAYAHADAGRRRQCAGGHPHGRHTVNAGQVYFAAGSFEPVDFPAGRSMSISTCAARCWRRRASILRLPCRSPRCTAVRCQGGHGLLPALFGRLPGRGTGDAIRHHPANGGDDEIEGCRDHPQGRRCPGLAADRCRR